MIGEILAKIISAFPSIFLTSRAIYRWKVSLQFLTSFIALLPAISYGSSLGFTNTAFPLYTSNGTTVNTGLDEVLTVEQMSWFGQ